MAIFQSLFIPESLAALAVAVPALPIAIRYGRKRRDSNFCEALQLPCLGWWLRVEKFGGTKSGPNNSPRKKLVKSRISDKITRRFAME